MVGGKKGGVDVDKIGKIRMKSRDLSSSAKGHRNGAFAGWKGGKGGGGRKEGKQQSKRLSRKKKKIQIIKDRVAVES